MHFSQILGFTSKEALIEISHHYWKEKYRINNLFSSLVVMLYHFDLILAVESVDAYQVSYEIDEEYNEYYDFDAADYIVILNESKCKAKRFINSILFDAAKLVEKYI
jgi:hypothetical protein